MAVRLVHLHLLVALSRCPSSVPKLSSKRSIHQSTMEMAGVRTALVLLPPVSVVLFVMAVRRLRAVARAQFERPPSSGSSSSSLRSYLAVEKGELPVALYRRSGGETKEPEPEHATECVFCLSGIEEGPPRR
ncbi:hypothetical protein PAHAL_2G495600 [Panicum hallii]|jgi:hypothetical protein|uniref:Uncharacterized protein n=1 Tax=Panicum hallii TaxID=206008 RepID=A0A2T8KTE7_9POAL|nr:hypothetical protein PAHAL_2G495600 [Panicum hallii]